MQEPPIAVLAVDDEPGVLMLLQRYLDDADVGLTQASSGKAALEHLAALPRLDLMITDLHMPAMNGDELARVVRAQHPDLRVLYLTGHADDLFDAKGQLWAGEAYLEKPFTRAALREAVALLLFERSTL
jgi:CheY-like chemotaxis protein